MFELNKSIFFVANNDEDADLDSDKNEELETQEVDETESEVAADHNEKARRNKSNFKELSKAKKETEKKLFEKTAEVEELSTRLSTLEQERANEKTEIFFRENQGLQPRRAEIMQEMQDKKLSLEDAASLVAGRHGILNAEVVGTISNFSTEKVDTDPNKINENPREYLKKRGF